MPMHTALVDFLNHGVLPFVGRTIETGRIVEFWRATIEGNRLRVALLTGEAGTGKSRLVEETIPVIVQEGGTVVHTKLYPESTASIAPMIAQALHVLATRRHLNIGEPHEDIPSVTAALRRLARLRPTLLIIEDIHLLGGEALREFSLLLDGLSEEVISLLALTRPAELPVRGLLERYLVEEITLRNLDADDLAALWSRVFGTPADGGTTDLLGQASLGNPLAVRSALRGALKSGTIGYDPMTDVWRPELPTPALLQSFRRSVDLLSEGMAAHLNDAEREGAATLARLGEIFSREAALTLLPDAGRLLEALIFKGIVSTSLTHAPPLTGAAGIHPPLAFTHTLLHDHLVGQSRADSTNLLRVIASDVPLYSLLPFELLARDPLLPIAPRREARRAIAHTLAVARALDASPDWNLGMKLWETAEVIMEAYRDTWSPKELETLRAELLVARLILLRRSSDHDEYEHFARSLAALTDEPTPPHLREYRLMAFSFLHALDRRSSPERCRDTWNRAQGFLARHPKLRFGTGCLMYMDSAARSMLYTEEHDILRRIDELLTDWMNRPEATGDFRHEARHIIVFHCLELFSTEEELERRLRQMAELEPHVDQSKRMSFLISKIVLLCSIGQMEETIRTADQALPQFRKQNLTNNFYFGSLARSFALGALGAPMEEIEDELMRLCRMAPYDIRNFSLFAQMTLAEIGLLRNDNDWLNDKMERYRDMLPNLSPEAQVILRLERGLPLDRIREIAEAAAESFRPMLDLLLADSLPDREKIVRIAGEALQRPLLRLNDLIERRAILAIIGEIARRLNDITILNELRPAIHDALDRALAWLADRGLHPYMPPLPNLYAAYFSDRELADWRSRTKDLAGRTKPAEQKPGNEGGIRLTMLGMVEIHMPDGRAIPVRGSRLRTLLGLLVADRMLDAPLEHREFSAIASGSELDPDRARKTLNGIVFRLREVIGHDAIDTAAETPRLNLDLVAVDLLDAYTALREAEEALREGSLLRAHDHMAHALAVVRGEVPFPNLYENFFEAAREDFENALRRGLIRVAKRLLSEGDPTSAEELLRQGFAVMEEDEELADLLRRALMLLGKRAEAERIRLRLNLDA